MASATTAFMIVCAIALTHAQAPPQAPAGAAGAPTGPAVNQPAGPPQAGPSDQQATPAPITKLISPLQHTGLPTPAGGPQQISRQEAITNESAGGQMGGIRSKRQAGIPPVCCTKDPCDPCATTPCIACPLCG